MIKSGSPVTLFNASPFPGGIPTDSAVSLLCEGADKIIVTASILMQGAGAAEYYLDAYFNWDKPTPPSYITGQSATTQILNPLATVSGSPITQTVIAPPAPGATGWFAPPFIYRDIATFKDKSILTDAVNGSPTIVVIGDAGAPGGTTYTYMWAFDNPGATAFKLKESAQGGPVTQWVANVSARALFIDR